MTCVPVHLRHSALETRTRSPDSLVTKLRSQTHPQPTTHDHLFPHHPQDRFSPFERGRGGGAAHDRQGGVFGAVDSCVFSRRTPSDELS
jgi:hypothetical protein